MDWRSLEWSFEICRGRHEGVNDSTFDPTSRLRFKKYEYVVRYPGRSIPCLRDQHMTSWLSELGGRRLRGVT